MEAPPKTSASAPPEKSPRWLLVQGRQARLYIPDNIEALFRQFGKRSLIDKQKRKALFDEKNRSCLPLIQLIEQHNAGLEQEIVGLPEWTQI